MRAFHDAIVLLIQESYTCIAAMYFLQQQYAQQSSRIFVEIQIFRNRELW